jgi:hypothetical protein
VRLPVPAVVWILVAAAALWIVGTLLLTVRSLPTRPPLATQYFRIHLFLGGVISLLSVAAWFIWQQVRRSRASLPVGVLARTHLPTASQALVVVAVLLALMVLADGRSDRAHQAAYAAACEDPIGDKLGPDWQTRYFGSAREVLASLENRTGASESPSRSGSP